MFYSSTIFFLRTNFLLIEQEADPTQMREWCPTCSLMRLAQQERERGEKEAKESEKREREIKERKKERGI